MISPAVTIFNGTRTFNSPQFPSNRPASNPNERNFMQAQIGRAYTSTALNEKEPGVCQIKLNPPETGYTAYYVELAFPTGTVEPLKFSTGVTVVPDVVEFEWKMAPASARE